MAKKKKRKKSVLHNVTSHDGMAIYLYVHDKNGIPYKPINTFIDSLGLKGRKYNTKKAYTRSLSSFLNYLDSRKTDYLDTRDFKQKFPRLLQDYALSLEKSPASKSQKTIIRYLMEILRFYHYHFLREGNSELKAFIEYMIEDYRRPGVYPEKNVHQERYFYRVTHLEFAQLDAACNHVRDKAMIKLMYDAGLRSGEVLTLKWSDLDPASNLIKVSGEHNPYSMAFAKSGFRYVTAPNEVFYLLSQLRRELKASNRLSSQYIFVTHKGVPKPIKYGAIKWLFTSLGEKTGIVINPHMLRKSFAQNLFDRGVPLEEITLQLGHGKNTDITLKYYLNNKYKVPSPAAILQGNESFSGGAGI